MENGKKEKNRTRRVKAVYVFDLRAPAVMDRPVETEQTGVPH